MTPEQHAFNVGLAKLVLAYVKGMKESTRRRVRKIARAPDAAALDAIYNSTCYLREKEMVGARDPHEANPVMWALWYAAPYGEYEHAITAGVPEEAVTMLRALTLGDVT